jgi:diguanylate cyclase (GGDEF)-like protein
MEIALSPPQREFLQQQVDKFYGDLLEREILPIRTALGLNPPKLFTDPPTIKTVEDAFLRWRKLFIPSPEALEGQQITNDFAPLLKAALVDRRRAVAADVDQRLEKTLHPEAIAAIKGELTPFDELASQAWFRDAVPLVLPRVADFLTLEQFERVLQERVLQGSRSGFREREYDEKFHLLQAPRLLIPDLAYYRETSGARGNSVALAFVDIDDFKHLNTTHRHVLVDQLVLPVFMRYLEAFTFARGFAYRMHGDEYAILLGNGQGAVNALDTLRRRIPTLTYQGVSERLTVSIGLCCVPPTLDRSDRDVYQLANRAMRYAKDQGKNCLATYTGEGLADSEFAIISRDKPQA